MLCTSLAGQSNPGQHPIVIMRDIPYKDMSALLAFIYQGEVTVTEEELPSFLKTAKALEVRGLTDDDRAKTGGGGGAASAAPRPVSESFVLGLLLSLLSSGFGDRYCEHDW